MKYSAAVLAAAVSASCLALCNGLPSTQFQDARSVVVAAEEASLAARAEGANNSTSASQGNKDQDGDTIYPSFNTSSCPGYKPAGPVKQSKSGFTMPLTLAGPACNAYGVDIHDLTLSVVYEKAHQLHVHVYDMAKHQYQLPLDGAGIFTRLGSDPSDLGEDASTAEESHLEFHHSGNDVDDGTWGFWITRKGEEEGTMPLFDTRSANIPTYAQPMNMSMVDTERNTTAMPNQKMIFENQYVQLASALPVDANVYGLGERYSAGGIGDASWRLNPDNMLQPFFALDIGDPPESNMYGYQPIYLDVRNSSMSDDVEGHVVAYQNTAGLDIIMRRGVIQYRGIGGTLDFRFFSGKEDKASSMPTSGSKHPHVAPPAKTTQMTSSPQIALEQYVQYVNLPVWHPAWSMGYHQLRWGIHNVSELQDLHRGMRKANIPLECMWNDIDYLHAFRDFTVDPNSYGNLSNFIQELHDQHQHYIPIIDAAVPAAPQNDSDVYAPSTRGMELDVFMKNTNGSVFVGKVWPGWTFFVDEHHKNAQEWWREAYANLTQGTGSQKAIHLDGLWIDMNEPSSPFAFGSAGDPNNLSGGNTAFTPPVAVSGWPEGYDPVKSGRSGNITVNGTKTYTGTNMFYNDSQALSAVAAAAAATPSSSAAPFNPNDTFLQPASHKYHNSTQRFLWDPPYEMHNGWNTYGGSVVENLNKKTVAMDTVTSGGKFYDVKNLDGTLLVRHAYESLRSLRPKERPFIVSRSTYPGFGGYALHWLGDNTANWGVSGMVKNIQGALQFQLFGVQTGSDLCGFNANTDEELCNRWMMMGAFMPFMRNHNIISALSQEPFRWDSVANASRIAIGKRYELLPEIYTQRARNSQRGKPFVKSLWMEFPSKEQFSTLRSTDTQYMFGSNLLVSPVLEPGVEHVNAYFPSAGGKWRNVFTYEAADVKPNTNTSIPAELSTINVHQRPGTVMLSYVSHGYTIHETMQKPYALLVNLNDEGEAQGNAYVDDGTSMPPTPSRELVFQATGSSLEGSQSGDYDISNKLDRVVLMGVKSKPKSLMMHGKNVMHDAHYDASRQMLNATNLDISLNKGWKIEWSM